MNWTALVFFVAMLCFVCLYVRAQLAYAELVEKVRDHVRNLTAPLEADFPARMERMGTHLAELAVATKLPLAAGALELPESPLDEINRRRRFKPDPNQRFKEH